MIALGGSQAEDHAELGLNYYQDERYEEALEEFKKAVELEPDNPQYHIYLAGAYERCGEKEKAIEELEIYRQLAEAGADVRGMGDEIDEVAIGDVTEKIEELEGAGSRSMDYGGKGYPISIGLSGEPIFRFMVIGDPHMGEDGAQDSRYLSWIVNEAYPAIRPKFIVNVGDSVDGTNGGFIPMGGPYQSEWDEYRIILDQAGMNVKTFYDIPGNHDAYGDAEHSYFLRNSIQGQARGDCQQAWKINVDYRTYQFLAVDTSSNDGGPWPIDMCGLDSGELEWIEANMDSNADLIFFFGHHPITKTSFVDRITGNWKGGGREEFKSILRNNNCVYIYGHTHVYGTSYYEGVPLVNTASIGKSPYNHYLVVEVNSNNGVRITPYDVGELP